MIDTVTGTNTEISVTTGLSPSQCWDLITDIGRAAEHSPECFEASWLDTEAPGPRPGARFVGRNTYGENQFSEVMCVVTESAAPHRFGWAVLDPGGELDRAGSLWNYELTPTDQGGTRIRQRFEHGPGDTGARRAAEQDPAAMSRRLTRLRHNMLETLTALVRTEEAGR